MQSAGESVKRREHQDPRTINIWKKSRRVEINPEDSKETCETGENLGKSVILAIKRRKCLKKQAVVNFVNVLSAQVR